MTVLGVNLAVIQDGRILLIQREDFEVWCLPGGGLDFGESLPQAAVREAREETGLEVELTGLVGLYSRPGRGAWGGHIVLFAARVVGGELRPQPGEAIDVRYFSPDELPQDLVSWHRRRITDAFIGVGGAVARCGERSWPFEPWMDLTDVYRLRDASGLSRSEFYYRYMSAGSAQDGILEVPGGRVRGVSADASANGREPQIGVNVAIIQDGEILLTQREDFEVWCLPGGGVEQGESLAQAAIREVQEEVGLQVRLRRLVGIYSYPNWFQRGLYLVLFVGEPLNGRMQLDPQEVIQAGYFRPVDFPGEMMDGNRQRAIEALDGLGGGRAWRQRYFWPFDPEATRQQIYDLRDRSGLPRAAFYRRHFEKVGPADEILEVESNQGKNEQQNN